MSVTKTERREKVKKSIRKKVFGSVSCPRLSVFRSNKEIYAQVIDDENGRTLAAASSYKNKAASGCNKSNAAALVGKELAEKAKSAGVAKVVFDRNGYKFHGRVKALADAAREGGLIF